MISKSNLVFRVATFALLAVAIGGCTKSQQSDAQSTAAPLSQPTVAQPAVATAQPQSATTVAPAGSNAGLASSEGDKTGTKLVVNSLARGSGDTVTLRFTLVNNSAAQLFTGIFHGDGYHSSRDMSGVHLIDAVSKKKYFAIADTDGICLCSQGVDDIAPNSQAAVWAKFPAPPPSVTKITVEVPHFIPLENVPITQ
jgi:hypothetical protein